MKISILIILILYLTTMVSAYDCETKKRYIEPDWWVMSRLWINPKAEWIGLYLKIEFYETDSGLPSLIDKMEQLLIHKGKQIWIHTTTNASIRPGYVLYFIMLENQEILIAKCSWN